MKVLKRGGILRTLGSIKITSETKLYFKKVGGRKMEFLITQKAEVPKSIYSQGVKVDKYVFCAGARPIDPGTQLPITGDFRAKVRCTLDNIKAVLAQGNASLENVFNAIVYVRNLAERPIINEVFREYFQEGSYPTRVAVEVARLIDDVDIEILCAAYVPDACEKVDYLKTKNGLIPTGPFSQGIKIGSYVYCAGVRPIDPATKKLVEGDFRTRVIQCYQNAEAVLAEAGASIDDVYSTVIHVRNMTDLAILNEVSREFFKQGNYPIRILAEVNRINEEHDIEIECSAYMGPKKYLQNDQEFTARGPFSEGVKIGEFVYCSGVLPIDPITQSLAEGNFENRVRKCLDNLGKIMALGDANFSHVFTTTVFLRNMINLPIVDKVFAEYFKKDRYPVRHVVEINRLKGDLDIEIACSAYLGDQSNS